ncbi:HvfC/BufC family peptide modification chaperone [Paucibacter sp. B51]|uniref:HvfC/BufC family peptide modification chaperone n=1 Tax=Paucibacter sp. B51 TaxID=2993315 RepID=UPI0022EBBE9C|nr:putative DNA-binding domain-containing protein [Paucibacter sp. B51]
MSLDQLLQRQQALLQALTAPPSLAARALPESLAAPPGLKGGVDRGLLAYQLNAQVMADKVLAQAFPRLREVLGESSFAAMAWECWRQRPPQRGDLGEWGQVLPDFLAEQEGMDASLLELAQLEWAAHGLERGPDDGLDAESLQLMATESPADYTVVLRAGSRLLDLSAAAWNAWQGGPVPNDGSVDATPTPVLLWRPFWRVEAQVLSVAEAAFTRALLQACSLEQALEAAQAADPCFDFTVWLQRALERHCLSSVRLLARP